MASPQSAAASWTRSGEVAFYTLPFLYIGTWRRIMFPEVGRNIPFTIENYAFVDDFGRETVSWVRTFESTRRRRFDAYMVYSEKRGLHRRLPRIARAPGGGHRAAGRRNKAAWASARVTSDSTRGLLAFSFPMLFSGVAEVREWYDEAAPCFRIEVDVRNQNLGTSLRLSRHVLRGVGTGRARAGAAPRPPERQESRE